MVVSIATRKGNCEVCEVEAVLYCGTGNIWMCKEHKAEDDALTTANAKSIIVTSQKVDSTIELKADIFNTATTSFTDLQSAILANNDIPVEKKNDALMSEVASRIAILDAAIFAENAALVAKRNERHALLINAQQVHARLREVEKAKFRQFDVNYQPKVVKPTKAPSTPTPKLAELKAAAAKYNNPAITVQRIKSVMLTTRKSPADAAKHLAEILGII